MKKSTDTNRLVASIVEDATVEQWKTSVGSESKKNPAAVALGRLGGQKGGKARAAKLSAFERTEIARKAAEARWRKQQEG